MGDDSRLPKHRLPDWPRLMPEEMAAAYLGVSLSQFRREQARGLWPKPKRRGARLNTYDRRELDDAVDRLEGGVNHPTPDYDREFDLGKHPSSLPR
jgi:hypothetical protein